MANFSESPPPDETSPSSAEDSTTGNIPLAESEPEPSVLQAIPDVSCWRCGKSMPITGATCPTCKAVAKHEIPEELAAATLTEWGTGDARVAVHRVASSAERFDGKHPPVVKMFYFFVAFLGLLLIYAAILHKVVDDEPDEARQAELNRGLMTGFDIVSSLLTLVAVGVLPRPPSNVPSPPRYPSWVGWVVGPCLVAAAFGLNLGYHALLRSYLHLPEWMMEENFYLGASAIWLILSICVQPGIFEELFFRHLALGHLRGVMGLHAAVWVSSLMFGMAHLSVPLSMPVLTVVGVALGYSRVMSGSLVLPMLLHAAHNGVVVYLETHS